MALRLTGVLLENWRNFTHAKVALTPRAFLVGPNASGKSNFLDAFRFLRDIVRVGGGFQEAVRKRGGVTGIRSLAARAKTEVAIQVGIGNGTEGDLWQYEIRFKQSQKGAVLTRERVMREGREVLLRPNSQDDSDPERLTQTYLEQVNVNRDFREVAAFFQTIAYLHIVPQLVREPERSFVKGDDPYGGHFLDQVARTDKRVRRGRLKKVVEALRVAVPQLLELDPYTDARGVPHLRGRYEHWRPQGAWQTEQQFSDGTLRLLGLLWALLDGKGPLLLEEPELSLHAGVVRFLPQMFARIESRTGRQVLVSTHSQDLLKDPGIGVDEVLVLIPDKEGTTVKPVREFKEVESLLRTGQSLADAILPRTQPQRVYQLTLFGNKK